jgi:membrane-associated phospholipid phosphatase
MKNLFYKFFNNLANCFTDYNLLWQVIAIVLTFIIVQTDFDWLYFKATRFIPSLYWIPAAAMGGLLPIIIPLALLLIGFLIKKRKVLVIGWTLGQAAISAFLLSIIYKAFTGRLQPDLSLGATTDISHYFRFGFMRGGVFWGWPSSHTLVAFAMAFALISLYPKNKLVLILSLIYALYIGLAVSISIHWFSEFIAGMIFGTIIGLSVGRAFKQKFN